MPELVENSWNRERLLESLESYRCGLSEAPLLQKWSDREPQPEAQSEAQSTAGESEQQMTFVISNEEVDRHGDVIRASGWQLESYQKNPVFLWAHDYARPVIGRASSVWRDPGRLLATIEFAPTEFAQEVATLYRQNYQKGVSVGLRPIRFEERRHEQTGAFLGIRFLEQELLEVSAVPVPANRTALSRALDQAPRVGSYLRRMGAATPASPSVWEEGLWPELAARIDDLDKLVGELTEMLATVEKSRAGHSLDTEMAREPDLATLLSVLSGAKY